MLTKCGGWPLSSWHHGSLTAVPFLKQDQSRASESPRQRASSKDVFSKVTDVQKYLPSNSDLTAAPGEFSMFISLGNSSLHEDAAH